METFPTIHKTNTLFTSHRTTDMKAHALYRLIAILLAAVWSISTTQAQSIAYVIPDIGTPGMNTMVEIVAPHLSMRTFGLDGFYANNPGDAVRVVCADPDDTNRVTVGPVVVSWDGRLITTQIFVHPDQQPPSSYWYSVGPDFEIPLQVYANGTFGNLETFYIVRPQPALFSTTSGEIGSGGVWGLRSKRGAMIVDSVDLSGAQYSISTMDADVAAPGNQGYLPAVIISKGPVRTSPSTIIHVNGSGKTGGPGGGGGGGNFCDWSGIGSDGGDGFTGGGPGGRNRAGNPFGSDEYRNPGTGSGAFQGRTGGSLSGVPGGDAPAYEASGGGTGHPFGNSGSGCSDGSNCNPPGGYGGGSGQQQTQDGGAGGYATPGQSSRNNNGGKIYGNDMIVPLAGGSGGASGNPQQAFSCSGDGGSGGGALRLYGRSVDAYLLTAHGGDGSAASSANGGAGSGGAVSVEGKLNSGVWKLMALGGNSPGPKGGAGRIRMDGPIGWYSGALPTEESMYIGPSTDTSMFVPKRFLLSGTGNGQDITLYIKSARSPWTRTAVVTGYSGMQWTQELTVQDGDGIYFVVALQSTTTPSSDRFLAVPVQVMSQAAANILLSKAAPHIAAALPDAFPSLRCTDEEYDTLFIRNVGDAALELQSLGFSASGTGFSVIEPSGLPIQIQEGDSVRCVLRFSRVIGNTGIIRDTLRIYSNDENTARNPLNIPVEILVEQPEIAFDQTDIKMPDVVLCQSVSADTTITLRNMGTVPLLVSEPGITGASVSLIAPPALSFPLVIPVGGALDVTLRITHTVSGTQSSTVSFTADSAGCYVRAAVVLTGTAGEADPVLEAVADYPVLYCFGEQAEERTTLRNDGDVEMTVRSISVNNSYWEIVSPIAPFILPPSASAEITIRFRPLSTGSHNGVLRVETQPCDIVLSQPLTGRRDSVGARANDISFGVRHTSEFPLVQNTQLVNTGDVPVTIQQLNLFPPFELLTSLPVTIQPGDSIALTVRFNDPGRDGNWSWSAAALSVPLCDSIRFSVDGGVGEASVEIVVGDATAAAGDEVRVHVYLRNLRSPSVFGATSISSTLVVDASLLVPLFQPSGSVIGGLRRIPITIPLIVDAEGIAATFPFVATLGISESSPMTLDQSSPVGGRLSIIERAGQFVLADICREGGTRLFDGSVRAGIQSNYPNPFNPLTEIHFTTLELGHTELLITDFLGRKVAVLYNGIPEAGDHHVRFDAQGLPSGVYFVILQTPAKVYRKSIILTK
jgi:hypothetical protein